MKSVSWIGFSKLDSITIAAKIRVSIIDEDTDEIILTLFAPHNLKTMIETGMSVKAMIIKSLIISFNRVALGRSEYIIVVSSIIKEDIDVDRIATALDEAFDDSKYCNRKIKYTVLRYRSTARMLKKGMLFEVESDVAGYLGVLIHRSIDGTITMQQEGLAQRVVEAMFLEKKDVSSTKTPATEFFPIDTEGKPPLGLYNYASVVGMLGST